MLRRREISERLERWVFESWRLTVRSRLKWLLGPTDRPGMDSSEHLGLWGRSGQSNTMVSGNGVSGLEVLAHITSHSLQGDSPRVRTLFVSIQTTSEQQHTRSC